MRTIAEPAAKKNWPSREEQEGQFPDSNLCNYRAGRALEASAPAAAAEVFIGGFSAAA